MEVAEDVGRGVKGHIRPKYRFLTNPQSATCIVNLTLPMPQETPSNREIWLRYLNVAVGIFPVCRNSETLNSELKGE